MVDCGGIIAIQGFFVHSGGCVGLCRAKLKYHLDLRTYRRR